MTPKPTHTPEEIEEALILSVQSRAGRILATAYREAAAERDALKSRHSERVAQLVAHRACCGVEHDPQNGKLHGYCVVCGVPWPCEYAGSPPADKERAGKAEPRVKELEALVACHEYGDELVSERTKSLESRLAEVEKERDYERQVVRTMRAGWDSTRDERDSLERRLARASEIIKKKDEALGEITKLIGHDGTQDAWEVAARALSLRLEGEDKE